ncbi:MAG: hypothetical protein NTZ05_13285 [Chloroflexi bacterium]|nr:hypothetical protein [Chloroflexota bacterium]
MSAQRLTVLVSENGQLLKCGNPDCGLMIGTVEQGKGLLLPGYGQDFVGLWMRRSGAARGAAKSPRRTEKVQCHHCEETLLWDF